MRATGATGRVPDLLDRIGKLAFLRFCAVGAIGFLVDAGVLLVAIAIGLGPVGGRLLSFAVAVLTTFELNRRWAFRGRGERPFFPALATYIGVQGLGFVLNFGTYALLLLGLRPPYNHPLMCLVVASVLALLINYVGASVWVFRERAEPEGEEQG